MEKSDGIEVYYNRWGKSYVFRIEETVIAYTTPKWSYEGTYHKTVFTNEYPVDVCSRVDNFVTQLNEALHVEFIELEQLVKVGDI